MATRNETPADILHAGLPPRTRAIMRIHLGRSFTPREVLGLGYAGLIVLPNVGPDGVHDVLSWASRLEGKRYARMEPRLGQLVRRAAARDPAHGLLLLLQEAWTHVPEQGRRSLSCASGRGLI